MSNGNEGNTQEEHIPVVKATGLLGLAEMYMAKFGMLTFGTVTLLVLLITLQVFFWGPMMERTMLAIDSQRALLEEQRLLHSEQKALLDKREVMMRRQENTSEQMGRVIISLDSLVSKIINDRDR